MEYDAIIKSTGYWYYMMVYTVRWRENDVSLKLWLYGFKCLDKTIINRLTFSCNVLSFTYYIRDCQLKFVIFF